MQKRLLTLVLLLAPATAATAQTGNVTMTGGWSTANSQYEYSGTFIQPAYDVEVTTELIYCLNEAADNSALADKTDVFLKRTIKAGVWNSFCAPFAIATPSTVFGEDVQVKELTDATLVGSTLTLTFGDAASIEACKPYLIKLKDGATDVNLADGHDFEGVTQSYTAVPKVIDGVVTFQPTITPAAIDANDKTVLFVTTTGELTWPSSAGTIKAFRAYFKLASAMNARAFVINFSDGEQTTGIIGLSKDATAARQTSTYDLQGRRINGQPTQKGVYIMNGKKTVIK